MQEKKINIIQDSLSSKVLDYFISDSSSSIQDLVSAYDLFLISFFSNFDNYSLSSIQNTIRLNNRDEKLKINNFLSSTIELHSGVSTSISISLDIYEENYQFLDEQKQPYDYKDIQVKHYIKKQGRSIDFKYNGYSESSISIVLMKNFDQHMKIMCKQLLDKTVNLELDELWRNNNLFTRASIPFSSVIHKTYKKTTDIDEKEKRLISSLETCNSHLLNFIESYKMLVSLPLNTIVSKPKKF